MKKGRKVSSRILAMLLALTICASSAATAFAEYPAVGQNESYAAEEAAGKAASDDITAETAAEDAGSLIMETVSETAAELSAETTAAEVVSETAASAEETVSENTESSEETVSESAADAAAMEETTAEETVSNEAASDDVNAAAVEEDEEEAEAEIGIAGIALFAAEDEIMTLAAGVKDQNTLSPISSERTLGVKDDSRVSPTTKASYTFPLYVVDDGLKSVAYCYNGKANWPSNVTPEQLASSSSYADWLTRNQRWYYKIEDATAADMNAYSYLNDANMKANVLRTVYNGYPYNQSNIKGTYGLDDMQFRCVTQAAIWWFTDREPLGSGTGTGSGAIDNLTYRMVDSRLQKQYNWTSSMTKAYNELVSGSSLVTPPASFELDIFIPDANKNIKNPMYYEVQNLLSTRITEDGQPTPQRVEVSVSKYWEDNDNQDGIRPNSVTVRLLADGVSTEKTKTLNAANGWSASFEDLPQTNTANKVISYTIQEVSVSGYTSEIEKIADYEFELTNTHTPETVTVAGSKTWADNDDQDGARPESITVILKAGGREVDRKTVTEADNWEWKFDNLPKYNNGAVIRYSVEEAIVPDGYESSVTDYNITNTFVDYETIAVQVSKSWVDSFDQDGIRPNSVTVHLYADGVDTGKTVVLNAGNNWTANFENLPKNRARSAAIVYTVKEDAVTGYTTDIVYTQNNRHAAITNTHTPETISVQGAKTWADNNNEAGNRPESITVILKAGGREIDRKTVTEAADNWKWEFTDLPKYSNGSLIRYSVEEADVPANYQSTVNGYNITNTYTPELMALQVAKSWVDNENQDGIRPNSITVYLYENGVKTDKSVILNAGNNWTEDFNDLPTMRNGARITYTVREENVPGYRSTIQYTQEGRHATITNTHNPETTFVEGVKTWNDNEDQDGKRPGSIIVILKAAGQEIDRKTVTADDNWTYKFTNLPKYEKGSLIRYSVEEGNVPAGYQSVVTDYNITNNYTPEQMAVQVSKSWEDNRDQDGIRPNSVTVRLYANGVDTGKFVILNEGNNWTADFENLDVNSQRAAIVYTVVEDPVPGYTTTITGRQDGRHFTITNTHNPDTTEVRGVKTWNDNGDQDRRRPGSVTIILKAAGQEIDRKTVTEADQWTYAFENLPAKKNGVAIRYSVEEADVPDGYQSVVTGYNITNNYTPEQMAVQVAKSWIDNQDQDGIRPNSITVHLFADGVDTGKTVVLDAGNNWTEDFKNLDVYRDGQRIVYTVSEDTVPGYASVITETQNGRHFTITNTHTPETTVIEGVKTWNDNEDQDGKRPGSVIIILKAGGREVARKTVTSATRWAYRFENLPLKENGTVIRYSVEEGNVPADYQSVVTGYNITNNYTPEEMAVQVAKSWIDNQNQDGIRPESVTVRLLANGVDTGKSVVLNTGNNWTENFENLPVYSDGKKIVYSVSEDTVDGYQTTITERQDGKHFTVTNTHTPELVNIKGIKLWDDVDDQDGKRPASVELILKAGGQEIARKIITEEDNWEWTFTDLPKYENEGAEIRYSVQEGIVPEGYQSDVDSSVKNQFTITNRYTPGKVTVQAAKSWIDHDDQDGIRPESVTVRLLADGDETGLSEVLTADNNWFAEFKDLDEYNDGVKIEYTVVEDETEGYVSTITGGGDPKHFTVTNTHNPELISIRGEKIWEDRDNFDRTRPSYIIVTLYANGVEYAAMKVTANDNWAWSFDNMPKYHKGEEVVYTMEEAPVRNFVSEVTGTASEGFVITNTEDLKEIELSKRDLEGEELPGAEIQVRRDGSIFVLDSWVSDGTPHKVSLKPGTYVMEETAAPEGYEIATKITFTVSEEGTVAVTGTESGSVDENVVVMVDDYTAHTVEFSKTDIAGNELEGASIEVTRQGEDTPLESWVSDGTPHKVSLKPGTYVMKETAAPEGYEIATEIVFSVDKKGTVTLVSTESGSVEGSVVTMVDDYSTHTVRFSKQNIAGEELKGASIQVSRIGDNAPTDSWLSDGTVHEIELKPGTYVMEETAAPEGYEIATVITFTVKVDGTLTVQGTELSAGDENLIVMIDNYKKENREKPEEPKPEEPKPENPKPNTPSKAVILGIRSNNWYLAAGLLAISLVIMGLGIWQIAKNASDKKKKNRES